MGNITKFINGLMVSGAIVIGLYSYYNKDPGLPDSYRQDHYWGPKEWSVGQAVPVDDQTIKKFTINVSDADLNDLKSRLTSARLVNSFKGTNFEYGFHSDQLKKVIEYWTSKYDWRKQEKKINELSHFKTKIEGLDVHFVRVKPAASAKLVHPLLLVHGWPGSVLEFVKLSQLLSTPVDGVAFELVIPSIPGFGWSDAPRRPGFNIVHAGRVFSKLMARLGHDKYFVHGGDWGSLVAKAMATLVPDRVSGIHMTMPVAKFTLYSLLKVLVGSVLPSFVYDNPEVDYFKIHPIKEKLAFVFRETGYMHIQATKPDTVGVGLGDSPAGLAAYILEKYCVFTDPSNVNLPDGGLTAKFPLDDLITTLMVYWTTNTATTSMRFYRENLSSHVLFELNFERVAVPLNVAVGVAAFPKEIMVMPKTLLHEVYWNITSYTDMPSGGHFAALEEPLLLADDIRAFLKSSRRLKLH